jgi:hypothetical protein
MDLLDILTFQCHNFKNKNKTKDYLMPNPIQTYDNPQNMRPMNSFHCNILTRKANNYCGEVVFKMSLCYKMW